MKYNGRIYKSINTCQNCPDRYLGCHDHCDKYQSALAEWIEKKASIRKAKRVHRDYENFRIEALAKTRSQI